jgi:hypothetical protein
METRIFNRTMTILSSDRSRSEVFNRGERVKNIRRVRSGVLFEPVDTRHVAGTYTMEWTEFMASTVGVREAKA